MEENITPPQQVTPPPSLPTEQPIQPIEPQNWQKDHHTSKYLIIGLIIALTIGGYTALAKFQDLWPFEQEVTIQTPTPSPISTPDPTTNWQTYTNEEFGLEFQYPNNYTQTLTKIGDCFYTTLNGDGPYFCIKTHDNSGGSSLMQWWKGQDDSTYLIQGPSIEMASEETLVFRSPPNTFPSEVLIFNFMGNIIELSGTGIPSKVISSFKTSQVDTSNWQTYRNEEFGFETKIPAGWQIKPTRPDLSYFLIVINPERDYFIEGSLIEPIRVVVSKNINNLTIDGILDTIDHNQYTADGYPPLVSEKKIIAGKEVIVTTDNPFVGDTYSMIVGELIVKVTHMAGGSEITETINGIISTLKFTN